MAASALAGPAASLEAAAVGSGPYVVATLSIFDPIAVADIEPVLGAVPPNRGLNEPSIDGFGNALDDLGAPGRPVAGRAIGMGRIEPAQDTGPDQEIVDQGIDRDHGRANFGPSGPIGSAAEQQARQRDAQHLVRYPVKVPQRPQNGFPHSADPIRRSWTIGLSEPPIEPADHISVSDVPNEKEQAVGHLV